MPVRNAALAIGVGGPEGLPFLAAAQNGARAFHAWAQAFGYDAHLLTDEQGDVEIADLRAALVGLLPPKAPSPHRLILYFAGHGLIRGAGEGLWLLSDWKREFRAVAIPALRARLNRYGIEQITIFSDACRSLPPDIDAARLDADGVLPRGPKEPPNIPLLDRYVAAQDGVATFAVPGDDPQDDRCVFSGVLLEGLWGTRPEAFSKFRQGFVISTSLGDYLRNEVPKVTQRYGRTIDPDTSSNFPEGDDIYFGEGPKPNAPDFPPWPPADTLTPRGPLWQTLTRVGFRLRGAGAAQEAAGPARDVMAERVAYDARYTASLEPKGPALLERIRAEESPTGFDTASGFAVSGANILRIWAPPGIEASRGDRENWWRVGTGARGRLDRPAPLLIELDDGNTAAVAALPDFIGKIVCDRSGVVALGYRKADEPETDGAAVEIASMEDKALRPGEVLTLAAKLRQGKHLDPVLGVLSAYLYDSVGDTDNIRRMAYYYVRERQPIPYDIALLAQLDARDDETSLLATVPAVRARKPTEGEAPFPYTGAETRACDGEVGGRWPWLRQGWTYLDNYAGVGSRLAHSGLDQVARHLKPARFTTFDHTGAQRITGLFGLRPHGR